MKVSRRKTKIKFPRLRPSKCICVLGLCITAYLRFSLFAWETYSFSIRTENAPACTDELSSNQVDFTLVTQVSPDRLLLMKEHCRRWGSHHPLSVAVGSKEAVSETTIAAALQAMGCDMQHVQVTVLHSYGEKYPVNQLRNLALARVQTTHALYVDADFLVSTNLYDTLLAQREVLSRDSQLALVVPAFELRPICDAGEPDCRQIHRSLVPDTKPELVSLFNLDDDDNSSSSKRRIPGIAPFNSQFNKEGHGSTRYRDWLHQPTNVLLPITCRTSRHYEPYFVVRYCQDLPPYQEAFTGYGRNKITWIQQVVRSGYTMQQLGGDAFVIHLPHPRSSDKMAWRHTKRLYGRRGVDVEKIAAAFDSWMERNVPDRTRIPLCGVERGFY